MNNERVYLVVSLPKNTNVKLLEEVITATVRNRQSNEADRRRYYSEMFEFEEISSVERKNGSDETRREYLISSEYVTVEQIQLLEEMKGLLPIEMYFENHGETATSYEEREEYSGVGEIEDDALHRLYYEEPHNRRIKISA